MMFDALFGHLRRLFGKDAFNLRRRRELLGGLIVPDQLHHCFWRKRSHHQQQHVGRVVKRFVALVQHLLGDLGDGVNRAGDLDVDRIPLVHGFQQIHVHFPVRVVVVHGDFLPDDAFFLFHAGIGKVRLLHVIQQQVKVGLQLVSAGKQIRRAVEAGERVAGGAVLAELVHDIPVLLLKHFMFQKMSDPVRHVHFLPVAGAKMAVD